MKRNETHNLSIANIFLLSILMSLFLVIGAKAPIVQASSTDTNASSLKKFDALIQEYANTDLIEDPMADTYKPSEYNAMKKDLDLYLQTQDCTTKENEMRAITMYVATRVYYNLKDKRFNPKEGTEVGSDNPYDVWSTKKAICTGYANLLTTLMYSRGIPSIQITAQNHGYNVCYDNEQKKWIYIDPTGCSSNRYTLDDQWHTNIPDGTFNLYFNITLAYLEKAPSSYFPYSVSNLKKDGILYAYCSCDSDYNTDLNVNNWKDTGNWFMSIVGPSDKNMQSLVVDTDNLNGIPITRIYAGFANTDIESVDLSKTVLEKLVTPTTQSAGSFEGCTRLKTVKLPDTVTYMDIKAFKNCTALEEINMPASLTDFTADVFNGCTSLTKVDFTGTDLIALGSNTFKGCTALKSVVLGKHQKMYISIATFSGCTALETVDCTGANINTIAQYAFYNCSSLKKLDFSDSTFTTTGQSTFRGCSSLTEIVFPSTLQEIEYYALYGTAIKTLDLSNTNITDIDYAGCYKMNRLTSIYLPKTLKTLGDNAFALEKMAGYTTRIYSPLSESEIRTIANQSKNVWSGRGASLSFPKGTYTLSYDGNGADAGEMTNETHPIESITFALTANAYTRDGYTFSNWNTKADGSGTSYKDKAKVASLTQTDGDTITLYAIWKKNSSAPDTPAEYTITYELYGGINHTDNPDTYTSDTETIVLQNPTREGYEFLGWFSDKNYTRQITEIPKGSTGNVTLYAKWEEEDTCQHEWMNGDILTPSTCTSKGTMTRTCMVCNKTETITIPKDPKNHGNNATVIRNKVEATTTKEGYTGDTYCKGCNKLITQGTTIPKIASGSSGTTTKPDNTSTPGTSSKPSTSTKPGNTTSTPGTSSKPSTSTKPDNSVTEKTSTTPDNVKGLKVVNKKGKALKITWAKQSGIKGYELQYAMDKKFKKSLKTLALKSNATSKNIKKLKLKKTYYVRIRCYTQTGTEKIYSAWSPVKKVKIKK